MEEVHLDRLQINPNEVNQTTGRIRIPPPSEETAPLKKNKRFRFPISRSSSTSDSGESPLDDLHRVWIPSVFVLCFIVCGVVIFRLNQNLQKINTQQESLTISHQESHSEWMKSSDRLKAFEQKDQEMRAEMETLQNSLKALRTENQALVQKIEKESQTVLKKIENLSNRELLIIDSAVDEKVETAPSPKK